MRPGRGQEWLRRYGPAELLALLGALVGYLLVELATGSRAAAAFGAAAGDNLGYYGLLVTREIAARRRPIRHAIRELALEFGPAETLDTALVRPALTALATGLLGAPGILVGKLLADLAFYAPVITTYELRKHRHLPHDARTA